MYMSTLLISMVQFLVLIAIGYTARKTNCLSSHSIDELSAFLLRFIVPVNVFIAGNRMADEAVKLNVLYAVAITVGYYALSLLGSFLISRLKFVPKDRKDLFVTMAVFANTGFIGYPLAEVLFGAEGVLYTVIINLGYNVFMFTLGIRLMGGEKGSFSLKRMFASPVMVASILSIALFFSPYRLPASLASFLSMIGSTMVPFSMFVLGGWMVGVSIQDVFKNRVGYLVNFLRLIFWPICVLFALLPFQLSPVLVSTCTLISALPIGSLNVILAKQYGGAYVFSNKCLMQSMVLSIITIPLVLAISNLVL